MNDLRKWLPADLEGWIETRVADGTYFDASDYLRDLVRRDRAKVDAQAEETAWLREQIAIGEASGVVDKEPEEIIEEIIAERRARHG
jgi:antitoxin ParD1/3/4